MEQRKYSMKDVQRMIQLSPYVLQDLLKKYPQHIQIEVVKGPDGEEVYMDHASLERLMFLKQLELNQTPTHDELLSQLIDPNLSSNSEPAPTDDTLKILEGSLELLSSEVTKMGDTLQQILGRYGHVLRDLSACRTENRQLQKEVESLRSRQNLIIGQITKAEPDSIPEDDGPKEKKTLN